VFTTIFITQNQQKKRMSDLMFSFIPLKIFGLLNCPVGVELELEPHQNFCPQPESHKNDAAPQH
jgi:hypothetical protein